MNIPRFAGKISADKLKSIPLVEFEGEVTKEEPVQYHTVIDGKDYDFLWYPKAQYKKIFVFFSGDILREKNAPPVYQRWSWAPFFPGNCLFISDPSLKLSDSLGLAWYAGSEHYDPLPIIAGIIKRICSSISIDEKDIVTYGSSGGGFAAIRSLLYLEKATAVAINPQTEIKKYHRSKVNHYLSELYPSFDDKKVFDEFQEKLDLFFSLSLLSDKKIIYVQNLADDFHVKKHAEPFFKSCEGRNVVLRKVFFEDSRGHGTAEDQSTFNKILSIIS